jgi:hypothetical protein
MGRQIFGRDGWSSMTQRAASPASGDPPAYRWHEVPQTSLLGRTETSLMASASAKVQVSRPALKQSSKVVRWLPSSSFWAAGLASSRFKFRSKRKTGSGTAAVSMSMVEDGPQGPPSEQLRGGRGTSKGSQSTSEERNQVPNSDHQHVDVCPAHTTEEGASRLEPRVCEHRRGL